MTTTQNSPVTAAAPGRCCPPFDPATWDQTEVTWVGKPFLKAHVTSVFHIPLNMGSRMEQLRDRAQAAQVTMEKQPLILSDESSPWGAELYLEVKNAPPGEAVEQLSGTYLTKVFEGPYRDAGKWMEQMAAFVAQRGHTMDKVYFDYTTCPACAKAYGKNHVVLFARIGGPGRQGV